jgi:inorganic pyrophosphatase
MSSASFVPLNDIREMKRSNSHGSNKDLQVLSEGAEDTLDFRLHTTDTAGSKISLWHDISLVSIDPETKEETPYLNFVCEIPKFTRYGELLQ